MGAQERGGGGRGEGKASPAGVMLARKVEVLCCARPCCARERAGCVVFSRPPPLPHTPLPTLAPTGREERTGPGWSERFMKGNKGTRGGGVQGAGDSGRVRAWVPRAGVRWGWQAWVRRVGVCWGWMGYGGRAGARTCSRGRAGPEAPRLPRDDRSLKGRYRTRSRCRPARASVGRAVRPQPDRSSRSRFNKGARTPEGSAPRSFPRRLRI
jgi:hypothetical protein